jgi:hypothetical protein
LSVSLLENLFFNFIRVKNSTTLTYSISFTMSHENEQELITIPSIQDIKDAFNQLDTFLEGCPWQLIVVNGKSIHITCASDEIRDSLKFIFNKRDIILSAGFFPNCFYCANFTGKQISMDIKIPDLNKLYDILKNKLAIIRDLNIAYRQWTTDTKATVEAEKITHSCVHTDLPKANRYILKQTPAKAKLIAYYANQTYGPTGRAYF